MILRIPDYYQEFECTANQCKHSCCVSWEIGIDEESYQYYCNVPGSFGERLRTSIKKSEHTHFQMIHGRCPFLSSEQLCEIYEELGEESLCEVCTEYPRFEVEYANTREKVMALSCEEVARILFTKKSKIQFQEIQLPGELETSAQRDGNEYIESYKEIKAARDYCIDLLQERTLSLENRLEKFLILSEQVQRYINDKKLTKLKELMIEYEQIGRNMPNPVLRSADWHASFCKRMDVMMDLEVMEEEWIQKMNNVMRAFYAESKKELYLATRNSLSSYLSVREYEYEHLIVYFVYRYLICSVYDGKFMDRAIFCLLCYRVIQDMDCTEYLIQNYTFHLNNRIDNVRIFSKEVEHSQKSLKYLERRIQAGEITSDMCLK